MLSLVLSCPVITFKWGQGRRVRLNRALSLCFVLGTVGCGRVTEGVTTEQEVSPLRVGNHDPRGVDAQPDWEQMAMKLRAEMTPRVEKEMQAGQAGTSSASLSVACASMLHEALEFYRTVENHETQAQARVAELEASRAEDQASCERETSLEAALCVQLRLREHDAEFPWILDQCSRAFPREPGATTLKPSAASSDVSSTQEIELAFVGDIIFGRYREDGFDPILDDGFNGFAEISDLLTADVLVANLETPVTETIAEKSPIASKYRFAASREHIKLLAGAGVDVVSLANNHYFDLRQAGQRDSPRILREEGILAIGASREQEPLFRVEAFAWQDWTLGFVAVTTRRNAPAREDAPALPFLKTREMEAMLAPMLKRARAEYDLLVVAIHWGDEYAEAPNWVQRKAAHALIDAGADVVVGHHPHVLQGIESYAGGVIAYSMGNFLFENTHEIPRQSGVLTVQFSRAQGAVKEKKCLQSARFKPAYIKRTPSKHPVPATGGMGKRVRARVIAQGKALGSIWTQESEGEALSLTLEGCR